MCSPFATGLRQPPMYIFCHRYSVRSGSSPNSTGLSGPSTIGTEPPIEVPTTPSSVYISSREKPRLVVLIIEFQYGSSSGPSENLVTLMSVIFILSPSPCADGRSGTATASRPEHSDSDRWVPKCRRGEHALSPLKQVEVMEDSPLSTWWRGAEGEVRTPTSGTPGSPRGQAQCWLGRAVPG